MNNKSVIHELIVVGGGASGLIGAITAKDRGIDTGIIEGNERPGKKLLITGNGRCNITNKNPPGERLHSKNPAFFKKVLKYFTVQDTIKLFASLGLPVIELEEGKMYPLSLQASSVLDILRFTIDDKHIPIYNNSKVIEIKKRRKIFQITTKDGKIWECKKLLLAAGGMANPQTGSDGSGLKLAKALGHNIITPIPSLVQLKLDCTYLKALSGVKFNGSVEIFTDNNFQKIEKGEILFTDYGISGPPILQISRIASYNLLKKKKVTLKVDLLPHTGSTELKDFLNHHWNTFNYRSAVDSLTGIIHKKIIPVILKKGGVNNIHKPSDEISEEEKNKIYEFVKSWEFKVSDTNSFINAQVTSGGIDTKEVNPVTLESKLIPGLFFSGEILDVDGDCGGFNLQWAWSSGVVAGTGVKS